MTTKTKSGVAGVVEHVRNKLLSHAAMAKGRPPMTAACLLPSAQQCAMLAGWLGAALSELEKTPHADRTAFDSSAWLGELKAEWRKAKRRKRTAARRNDVQAADKAQTDAAALEHVIDMMRRHSPTEKLTD